jgi:transposase, IS5 family
VEAPKEMVFDGCYYSRANRKLLSEAGVQQICFSKEPEAENKCSKKKRKTMRFFRAGIEASISILKRMFGWDVILNKGMQAFRNAVKTGGLIHNLFILARL